MRYAAIQEVKPPLNQETAREALVKSWAKRLRHDGLRPVGEPTVTYHQSFGSWPDEVEGMWRMEQDVERTENAPAQSDED